MKIISYLLLSLILLVSDVYTYKTSNEQRILKKYRFNQILLALDDEVYRGQIFNKSSNIVIKEDKNPLVFGHNKNNYLLFKKEENNKNKLLKIILSFTIIFMILIIITTVLYIKNRAAKKLVIDKLTKLPNYNKYVGDISKYNDINSIFIKVKLSVLSEINKKLGWSFGNKIIIEITNILGNILSNNSRIYKISGDKFYIITLEDSIEEKLNNIKNEIKKLKLKETYNFDEDIKISFYIKENFIFASEIFEYLEILDEINEEKEISVLELNNQLIKKLSRRAEIKRNLTNKELDGIYAVFQPKFDLVSKKILGAEALVRWKNDSLGVMFPDEFIFIAEELRKVYLIDYKIVEETLKFINKISKKCLLKDNIKFSFNISLQTFERDDFLDTIINLIQKYKVDSKLLEVELTETILGLNLIIIIEKINYLKTKGIQVSIDDFTAGNSAISLLSILPVDIIKFDKSILDRVDSNNKVATEVYKGLINIVKRSNFKIVAEGIETNEQLEFLKKHGVDIGQGYIFSRPISDKDFIELLQQE